ncbi:MAG: cation:proton antiporter [Desulfobulbaceae bacterium]|jgi:Kef-type K+ transport system membrane component KefB/Trk K+ transport system NAD-binding subunit|nr:cation:proton antiporter [Desulfobulbaceae bacterium]MDY0352035.1 cation:proton antiporter [Desulfobulbaceae bacterium]
MILDHLFYETALILAASAALGGLALWLRQPLIVAFILVGILVGPSGLDLVGVDERLQLLAEIGITVLLFVVGLKLDLHLIRTMGPVALATGLGQVAFTSIFGFLIGLALGFSVIGALYVAVALTFSSTIIIVKLLSDKREIDALHGRIAVGFLIVQDIAVILAMIGLTAMGAEGASEHLLMDVLLVLLKGTGLLAAVAATMRFVLPVILPHLARTQELLLLFAIAWAVLLASIGDFLGFSKEVGAFLAGVSLASTPFRESIAGRLVSLRDFMLLFFFIGLGAQLDLTTLGAQIVPALIFSAFVLIGNPLIVMAIMGFMGYSKRTGFLAGLTVAQISEFSLILGALGLSLGHIDRETLGLITLVGLITIGLSTYLILYSHPIYQRISPWLGIFERRHPYREIGENDNRGIIPADVILFGLGRYGHNISEHLVRRGKKVLAVDFDPQVVAESADLTFPVRYGDVEDPELLENLPLEQARWVVNTIPGRETNLAIIKALRARGYPGKVVLTAHNPGDAEAYRRAGADKVLWPYVDAAELAVDYLSGTREALTSQSPWDLLLEEVKLRPNSAVSGRRIGEIALRSRTGASIVAVDRGGLSYYDPDAGFRLFPGDRLILLGNAESLKLASKTLQERISTEGNEEKTFRMNEFLVPDDSPWVDRKLSELDLRRLQGVSVIGIQRGEQRIIAPSPEEVVRPGDLLLVMGSPEAIGGFQPQRESDAPAAGQD